MLFNSFAYMIFLPIVVILYWSCPRQWRTPLLLIASYVFYMFWKPIYGLLILSLTVANYFLGLFMEKHRNHKKLLLGIGIAFNLLVLGFFKYTYVTRDCTNDLLKLVGLHQLPPVPFDIILPLGISFFIFEFVHYIFEVYKGTGAVKSFMEFALFPAFFPTQVAGPVKRIQDFVPQLKHLANFKIEYLNEGMELILFGLFKKVCLADNLSVVVGRCYAHPQLLTGADMWLATWAFFFQVYFDFSGYTDVARGSALMMGFRVPVNFDLPLLASSISEFWRRWHISLSSWLKDYLFIPLGGSRKGELITARNLIITMAVCGIWHGAGVNFAVWGFYIGLVAVFHRLWRQFSQKHDWMKAIIETRPFHLLSIALTFNVFALGLAIFRAHDLSTAWLIMRKLVFIDTLSAASPAWVPSILSTGSSVVFQMLPFLLLGCWLGQVIASHPRFRNAPITGIMPINSPALKGAYLAALAIILMLLAPSVTVQYIYFQF